MRTVGLALACLLLASCGQGPRAVQPSLANISAPISSGGPAPPKPARQSFTVAGAAFSAKGDLLLTAYTVGKRWRDFPVKRLVLWEVGSGRVRWQSTGPDRLYPVAFLPGDDVVLVRARRSMQLWDVRRGTLVREFGSSEKESLRLVGLSPDGRMALAAYDQGSANCLRLWDVAKGELIRGAGRGFARTLARITDVALSRDGKHALVSYGLDGEEWVTLQLWNLSQDEPIRTMEKDQALFGAVAFSPDGKYAVATTCQLRSDHSQTVVWEMPAFKEIGRLDTWGKVYQFTPENRYLAIGNANASTGVVEFPSGRIRWTRKLQTLTAVAFSPNGTRAFTGSGVYGVGSGQCIQMAVWDLVSGRQVRTLADPPLAR